MNYTKTLRITCTNQTKAPQGAFVNLLVGNTDAHGKNISFFVGKGGITLAPFYDLVNTALYPEFDQNLAMALGDEFNSSAIHTHQLADFADSCQLPRSLVTKKTRQAAGRLVRALTDLSVNYATSPGEVGYLVRYGRWVETHCRRLLIAVAIIVALAPAPLRFTLPLLFLLHLFVAWAL